MANLETEIKALTDAVAAEFRDVSASLTGVSADRNAEVISKLNTTSKNVVGAINELLASLNAVDLTALIDDSAAATSTVYSSSKVESFVAAQIAAALEGEDLSDLAAALQANAAADLKQLNFGAAQTLTLAEQVIAQTNMGLGDVSALDLVNRFDTARQA